MDIPKVEPCYRCGLPITQDLVREPTEYGPVWACSDWDGCASRIHEQIKLYSNSSVHRDEEMLSYCTILARDPYFAWRYHFNVKVTNPGNGPGNGGWITTELHIDGPWNIHSFPSIVKDALEFAQDYDAESIQITNTADDILWEA